MTICLNQWDYETINSNDPIQKDLKRFINQPKKMEALIEILRCLAHEKPIPENCRPHMLTGQYKGCMAFHIGSDFLLIWIDEEIISLVRIGSHSELFGQKRK